MSAMVNQSRMFENTVSTYKTAENAKKVIDNAVSYYEGDLYFKYMISVNEDGRFVPVVVTSDYDTLHYFLHATKVCVINQ